MINQAAESLKYMEAVFLRGFRDFSADPFAFTIIEMSALKHIFLLQDKSSQDLLVAFPVCNYYYFTYLSINVPQKSLNQIDH